MESKVLVKSHELNLQSSHFISSSLGNTAAKKIMGIFHCQVLNNSRGNILIKLLISEL
jgi:hypothetical protein